MMLTQFEEHSRIKGFEGGISAKKYMVITDTSKATATRDLQHLHSINALKQMGSGRNISILHGSILMLILFFH